MFPQVVEAPPDDLTFYKWITGQAQQMQGQKNDPPGSPVGPYGHGQDGLFNRPGSNDAIFSAMMLPRAGALGVIPIYQGDQDNTDMFGGESQALDTILTGVTSGDADDFDNQPTADCAIGSVGGFTKLCTVVNSFGRYRFGVRETSMVRAGRRLTRVDPLTMRLMNAPQMNALIGVPTDTPTPQAAISNEIVRRYWESTVSAYRMLSRRVWVGSPANNSGEARDIVGLDIHINANNKVDYLSASVCTAANSDIYNFGYDDMAGSGRDIARYIEVAEYHSHFKASRQALLPFNGWIFMRPELWQILSEIWPIRQYQAALTQMAQFNNGRVMVNASNANDLREQYRMNMLLPINGRTYPVVPDDGMTLQTPTDSASIDPGEYAGSIAFVPSTVLGNVPATFFEYFDHDNAQEMAIQQLAGGDMTFTSDGGLYRHFINFKNGCIQPGWELSPRLKCKTPQIGWRINNVLISPLRKFVEGYPDSSYFVDGGASNTDTVDSYYAPWSTSTPVAVT